MKSAIKWMLIIVTVMSLGAVFWIGPSRLYGLGCARQIIGTVEKVQPHGSSTSEVASEFIVEVSATDQEIFTFVSADPKWGVMSKGDHVTVRLYPAAPWSADSGSWDDARVIAKLAKAPGYQSGAGLARDANTQPPAGAVAVLPQTQTPANAPQSQPPAPASVADNKPTAQGSALLTVGLAGLPALLGFRYRRGSVPRTAASS